MLEPESVFREEPESNETPLPPFDVKLDELMKLSGLVISVRAAFDADEIVVTVTLRSVLLLELSILKASLFERIVVFSTRFRELDWI